MEERAVDFVYRKCAARSKGLASVGWMIGRRIQREEDVLRGVILASNHNAASFPKTHPFGDCTAWELPV